MVAAFAESEFQYLNMTQKTVKGGVWESHGVKKQAFLRMQKRKSQEKGKSL